MGWGAAILEGVESECAQHVGQLPNDLCPVCIVEMVNRKNGKDAEHLGWLDHPTTAIRKHRVRALFREIQDKHVRVRAFIINKSTPRQRDGG